MEVGNTLLRCVTTSNPTLSCAEIGDTSLRCVTTDNSNFDFEGSEMSDETDSMPDLIPIEELIDNKNTMDIIEELTTELVNNTTSDVVDTAIANMKKQESFNKMRSTAEKLLDDILLEALNRAEVNETVQKSINGIMSETVTRIESDRQQESIDLEKIAFNALKTNEENELLSLERISLDSLGAMKAPQRSFEVGKRSFEFAKEEKFDKEEISYEPIKQLKTQYKLHEYFKNTNNFTRSEEENQLQKIGNNSFCDKNNFKLVGTESIPITMMSCSKAKIQFSARLIEELEREKNYFLSNVRINNASMKQFKEMIFEANCNDIDRIHNGSFDITNAYANIDEEDNSFQVPFAGTYDNNHIYMNNVCDYNMYMEANPNTDENYFSFVVKYDIYEGVKPESGDAFDIFQHQKTSEIIHGGYFSDSDGFYLKNKMITCFNHSVLGIYIKFNDGELLDLVESIKLRFKGQWNYEHVEEFDIETLKEFKRTFGEGIIPFVPKFQTKADSIRHSINCSACDVFVIEFDFIDSNKDYYVEVHALNYNAIKFNNNLQITLMYSN